MQLSTVLLVAVLGAVPLGRRPLTGTVLVPALTFLGISALSALLSGTYCTLDSWPRMRVLLVAGATMAVIISIYGVAQKFGVDPISEWAVP